MAKLLKAPFADGHSLWVGVELLKRILFVIFIIILPGNLVSIATCANPMHIVTVTGSSVVVHHGLCNSNCLH